MELLGLLWPCFRPLLLGGLRPPQTPPLLTWFSSFLVRSSANFAKKIQELAEDKAENPRTCRGQSREENPYERLQENSNLQAFFFQTPFLIATLPTPKTLGGGTPPRGASIRRASGPRRVRAFIDICVVVIDSLFSRRGAALGHHGEDFSPRRRPVDVPSTPRRIYSVYVAAPWTAPRRSMTRPRCPKEAPRRPKTA